MGNQTPNRPGIIDLGEEKISQLLSELPRVEAPGDFGFRVKARIADGRPARGTSLWMPTAVKAAVPLGLAVFVGGYFGITSFYYSDNAAPQQAAVETSMPEPVAPAPEPLVIAESQPTVVVADSIPEEVKPTRADRIRETVAKTTDLKRKPVNQASAEDKDSGDFDIGASDTRSPSPVKEPVKTVDTPAKGTPAGEVLPKIGVKVLFGEGGWKAESVLPNTAAAKAGVRAGDIIEAVDDQELSDLGSIAKPAKGKKLRVKRDGKSLEIVID